MATLTVYSDAADGTIKSAASTYAVASGTSGTRSIANAGRIGHAGTNWNGNYEIWQTLISFLTSSIGAASTVTAAVLSLYGQTESWLDSAFTIEARLKGWGSTLETGDWNQGSGLGSLTLLATFAADTGTFNTAGYNDFTDVDLPANVDKAATTYIGLYIDKQRLGTSPGSNFTMLDVYLSEASGTTQDPKLVVTYTPGGEDELGAATWTADASLAAKGQTTGAGTLALTSAAGTFSATGTVERPAASAMTATATLSIAALKESMGALAMAAEGSLSATAVGSVPGEALLTADASLAAAGAAERPAALAVSAEGSLVAAPGADRIGEVLLTADASLQAIGDRDAGGQATLEGTSTLSGTGAADRGASGALQAAGTFGAEGVKDSAGHLAMLADASALLSGDLILTGKSKRRLVLPKLSHSIASPRGVDLPVHVEDWTAQEAVGIGMLAASAVVKKSVVDRLPDVYTEGAKWLVTDTADGSVVFSGELLEPQPMDDGKVQLTGRGEGKILEDDAPTVIYRDDGTENWGMLDDRPHGYKKSDPEAPVSQKITAYLKGQRIVLAVDKQTKFDGGEANGVAWWQIDEDVRRVEFTVSKPRPTDHYKVQVYACKGPDGDLDFVKEWVLDAVADDEEVWANVDGSDYDQVVVLLRRREGHARKNSRAFHVALVDPKVYSAAKTADFTNSDVARDLAARLGISAEGVADSDTNALPRRFDDATWGDALIDTAVEDDYFTGVWNDGRGPVLYWRPWGRKTWYLEDPAALVQPVPIPRYDRVKVPYMEDGSEQWLTVRADPPPFPKGAEPRAYTIRLSKPGSKAWARTLGERVIGEMSRLRSGGSATFRWVYDEEGRLQPAHKVRAGDELVLTNHGGRRNRIRDIDRKGLLTTTNFDEGFAMLEQWLARIEHKGFRGRPRSDRSLDRASNGRPAAPTGVTVTPHAREQKVRLEYSGVVTLNEVLVDVDGEPCATDRYQVQLRPCTAGGVAQAEGKTRQKTITAPDEEDAGDTEATELKAVFHDLARPKKWHYQARARAILSRNRKGVWSAWSSPVFCPSASRPKPPAPDAVAGGYVLLDFDQNEKSRSPLRNRAIVEFREVTNWDVPGGDTEEDVDAYMVRLQRVTSQFDLTPIGEPRKKLVKAKDADANTFVRVIFPHVKKGHWYVADVRTIDRWNRRGDWSAKTAAGSASDTNRPPPVTGVGIDVDQHKVQAWCLIPTSGTDQDGDPLIHDDVNHLWWRLYRDGVLLREDRYHTGEEKVWKVKQPRGHTYMVKIVTVDPSGNKSSSFATAPSASGNLVDPPTPTSAPTLAFEAGGREKVRAKVTGSWGGSYTDDDIDHVAIRLTEGGRYRWATVDFDPGAPSNTSWEANFKGIKEGASVTAEYRVVDKKGHKSGWSPSVTLPATDTLAPPSPSLVSLDMGLRDAIVKWSVLGDVRDADHFFVEISNNGFGSVYASARTKATQKTFRIPAGSSGWRGRVSSVSEGGVASSSVLDFTGGAAAVRLLGSDFLNDRIGDDAGSDTGTLVTFETITAKKIRTATSGARVEMTNGSGENDRLKFFGTSGLVAYLTALGGDLYNSADFRTEGLLVGTNTGDPVTGFARLYKDAQNLYAKFPGNPAKRFVFRASSGTLPAGLTLALNDSS